MIGAMPAVAVRHERRRMEKRSGGGHNQHHQVGLSSRPSQLYVGGVWPPPHSPCSTSPSPGGNYSPDDDRLPEYYVCGKVSALQLVVGCLLLGAIVLIVGLVQLTPGADAADHRFYLMGAGIALIVLGLILTAVRCCCLHCPRKSFSQVEHAQNAISSIDMLVNKETTGGSELVLSATDTSNNVAGSTTTDVITSPSELDMLIKNHQNHQNHRHRHSIPSNNYNHYHHHHHHNRHGHRGSNGSVIHFTTATDDTKPLDATEKRHHSIEIGSIATSNA